MARIETLKPIKRKKKKLDAAIQPIQSVEGQKLFNTQGVNPATKSLSDAIIGQIPKATVEPVIKAPLVNEETDLGEQSRLRFEAEQEFAARDTGLETPVDTPVETPIETPVVTPKIVGPSVSDRLISQSGAGTSVLVAELKQRIAESVAGQQQLKAGAAQQFDPLRATSEVNKSQQLRSALERSSLLGDRGGIGRSEALATQTAGDNRLNAINLDQQNFINQSDAEIERLNNEGKFQEAIIMESQKAQLESALINEQVRQEGLTRNEDIRQEGLATTATEQKKQDFIATINRFAQDFTQEIQNVQNDGDPTNDWKIPLLESAKQDKIQTQGLDPLTGQPLPVDNTPELTSSSAIDLWEQTGVANEAISRALGIPVGTQYTRQSTGSSSGATGGGTLSDTGIRYKLTNGLPLSAAEAAKYGVEEGFILPQGAGTGGTDETGGFSKSTITSSIKNSISRKGTDTLADINNKISALNKQISETGFNEKDLLKSLEDEVITLENQKDDSSNASDKQIAMNWIAENAESFRTTQDLLGILSDFGIGVNEMKEFEALRDSALQDVAFQ